MQRDQSDESNHLIHDLLRRFQMIIRQREVHRRIGMDDSRIEHRHGNISGIEQHGDFGAAQNEAVGAALLQPFGDGFVGFAAIVP